MDINDFRTKIDEVDRKFVDLFAERMRLCGEVGLYKKENRRVIFDPIRERWNRADRKNHQRDQNDAEPFSADGFCRLSGG